MSDDELKKLFGALREDVTAIREENAAAHAETRRDSREVAAENRRLFEITTEGLRHEIRLVAEKVMLVDEKLDRESADIRREMRIGFADTQAMIKFSHAELDRRVRTLEENQRTLEDSVTDLQSRVDRLEGSTH